MEILARLAWRAWRELGGVSRNADCTSDSASAAYYSDDVINALLGKSRRGEEVDIWSVRWDYEGNSPLVMAILSEGVARTWLTKGMKAVASDGVVIPASAIQQYSNSDSLIGSGRERGVLAPDGVGDPTRERTPGGSWGRRDGVVNPAGR